jgi:group I intron endonuclease
MKKDIYIIKNDINTKVYIGQAINTKERFQGHCKPSAAHNENDLVAKAIQKYGKEHFYYEILESQIEDYNDKEKYYIKQYNSLIPNGYNILSGGEEPPLMRGYEHPEAILSKEDIENLTKDLKETNLSFVELAKKYNFKSNTSIVEFNKGITYVRDISYPIRKKVYNGKLTDEDVQDIIKLLKYTYRSYINIASQYNMEYKAIKRINTGELHHLSNIEYPIRKWKATSKPGKFTYEQVTDIIFLLQNTTLSLREIAKEYNCEYRDILNIKNGTTKMYVREGLAYPLRQHN